MLPEQPNDNPKPSFWHSVVVPTAVGMESFFWRLAWFGLLVAACFSGCLQRYFMPSVAEDSQASEPQQQVVHEPPRDPRPGH